jgi:hypothetical protein
LNTDGFFQLPYPAGIGHRVRVIWIHCFHLYSPSLSWTDTLDSTGGSTVCNWSPIPHIYSG